ncbi:hypothetical protein TRICI_002747 [Trichomonascus ciferrii]|uniref:Uncharacterized protein n=1 Tax=Trichomonascus ciferrii TaxID=44093 RepID=A0A642V548_9ASCO|nr:hypothetical protein TRICI_002747 [Trichomonascus ciferrii]
MTSGLGWAKPGGPGAFVAIVGLVDVIGSECGVTRPNVADSGIDLPDTIRKHYIGPFGSLSSAIYYISQYETETQSKSYQNKASMDGPKSPALKPTTPRHKGEVVKSPSTISFLSLNDPVSKPSSSSTSTTRVR